MKKKELEETYGSDLAEAIEDIGIFKKGSIDDLITDVNTNIYEDENGCQKCDVEFTILTKDVRDDIIERLREINNNICNIKSLSFYREDLTNKIQKVIIKLLTI